EALERVPDRSALARSTLYVSLEPCSHFGKTPPCADLIISSGIQQVVVAVQDPNPKVAGTGIARLKTAGIAVTVGVLEREARSLNRGFFSVHQRGRPWIILKWAQSADAFMAPADGARLDISCEASRRLVHQWRAMEDCVLVGTNTALCDDPQLTVRLVSGRHPLRAVLDTALKLPPVLRLFDGTAPTLVINYSRSGEEGNIRYRLLERDEQIVQGIMRILTAERVQSVIVEGGAMLLNSFIDAGLWDEARVFRASHVLQSGLAAPKIPGVVQEEHWIGDDRLQVIFNSNAQDALQPSGAMLP
ncbi:MAG: bifunctional diaminohydroxyphosphoribosylaminopyrimidine deaminase/5-amino-6-(5-phosphoribosylamino)uracil reductase RibD, partial [Proteobacteria bacterium]|nr:bifunctional diaminohydroxyphosphoribosylaminopyrimidine deaminase/5-amino-6-(5-phosphoribosylamino)uracil reductase RibD [Pseudomonadota bacterium]